MKEIKIRFQDFTSSVVFSAHDKILNSTKNRCLGVFDSNTASLIDTAVKKKYLVEEIIFPPSEAQKNLANIEKIEKRAVELGMGRDDIMIGIGGGVICDMTAFAASIFMRGCSLILVPTTLLAMVDASIGGKTGVDFYGYKNMIGTFYPAAQIRISTAFLKTLPREEYLCGLAEIIKHGFLDDREILNILISSRSGIDERDDAVLGEIIRRSIKVKSRIVERDPKESGEREILNFGHTFAHALESAGSFAHYPHGISVGWGMRNAFLLGSQLGLTDREYEKYALHILDSYGFPKTVKEDPEVLLNAMKQDKKKRKGRVRFVLQENLGKTFVLEVSREEIGKVLEKTTS